MTTPSNTSLDKDKMYQVEKNNQPQLSATYICKAPLQTYGRNLV